MATTSITSIQGSQIANNGSATDKANLSIAYAKVLGVLTNSSFNLMLATAVENKQQIRAGVAVYQVAQRGSTGNYTATAKKNAPSTKDVEVKLDLTKEYSFYLESNDLIRLGAITQDGGMEIGSALVGEWTKAMALGVQAYLTVKVTQLALQAATPNTIDTITLGTAAVPSGAAAVAPTIDDYRYKLWRTIAQKVAQLKSIVSLNYIGTNKEDFKVVVTPQAFNDILLTTTTIGSTEAYNTMITGRIEQIGGLQLIENIFLGQNLTAGAGGIDFDEAVDLSAADIIVMHRETIAFPYLIVSAGTYTDPFLANANSITKFIVPTTGGILRPDLVKAYKLVVNA